MVLFRKEFGCIEVLECRDLDVVSAGGNCRCYAPSVQAIIWLPAIQTVENA